MSRKPIPFLLAAWCLAAAGASAAQPSSEPPQGDALTVGVHYVPPPLVDGAKVRTPESIETLLVAEVARGLNRTTKFVRREAAPELVPEDSADFAVVDLPEPGPSGNGSIMIATGQVTRPMAIMRTDTDIKSWAQLKGRTVCVSEDGRYVGRIAQRYGAIEQVHRAPADSLLALRIGQCDAAVHDDTLLKALLRFPEWKKFSASLPPGEASAQYFVVPAGNPELAKRLKKQVDLWKNQGHYGKLIADMTRDIAFEVYLDQAVPDCH